MRGGELRSNNPKQGAQFDAEAQIVETEDGTLATNKSLMKQTGKQVVEDSQSSLDSAKNAIQDLLKKR